MKKLGNYLGGVFMGLFLLCGWGQVSAQESCKVLMPEISTSYTGGCKKGLAHGKGSAQGMDSYVGRFSKGLPNGSGTYTWADGSVYEGEWQKGIREGKGTMSYASESGDSTLTGIWKNNEYVGAILVPPFYLTRKSGVVRYSISKSNELGSGFRLAIYQAGRFNTDIEAFTMVSESGSEYQSGRYYGIENAIPPYAVTIKYRTWNAIHTQQSDVVFEFTINEPGSFEVSITN